MQTLLVNVSHIHDHPSWKHPRCPPRGEWINKLGQSHTVEYYSATGSNPYYGIVLSDQVQTILWNSTQQQGDEQLEHATPEANLKDIQMEVS